MYRPGLRDTGAGAYEWIDIVRRLMSRRPAGTGANMSTDTGMGTGTNISTPTGIGAGAG